MSTPTNDQVSRVEVEGDRKSSGTSIGRRFAYICAIPIVTLAISVALYIDYHDTKQKVAAQQQKAEIYGDILGFNASMFVLTEYDERFKTELDSVASNERDFIACQVFDVSGGLLLEWDSGRLEGEFDDESVCVAKRPLSFDGEALGTIEITFDMNQVYADLAANRKVVIAVDLAMVLLIILLCVQEGRRLTKKIQGLVNVVEGFADGGFDQRAPEGQDEMGRLGSAFNLMAADLGQSTELQNQEKRRVAAANQELKITYEKLQADLRIREQLEAELSQVQKLEAIGQLAAGIAHEINTPTQYIGDNIQFVDEAIEEIAELLKGYTAFLEGIEGNTVTAEQKAEITKLVDGCDVEFLLTEMPAAVEQSLEGIDQVASIVKAMKEFSHQGEDNKIISIDVNQAISSTIVVARSEWRHHAEVETELDPDLPSVPCYEGPLKQVFLNLIVNAAHAIEDVPDKQGLGVIRIETRQLDNMAEIRIIDSGCGIPEAVREKVFDPFFTTKDVGRGTGQGLSIAYECIASKHEGSLTFETELGVGTTFIIRLPLASELVEASE